MDIKWKDGNGNILNANKERIIYLDAQLDLKTVVRKEEVKKITMEDGMMNLFRDFENDLIMTIVIPKKQKRSGAKIFNEYDKTGTILKRQSRDLLADFLLDLIFESTITSFNPLLGIAVIVSIALIILFVITAILVSVFGDIGFTMAKFMVAGYPLYALISYILMRIKRKRIKERN